MVPEDPLNFRNKETPLQRWLLLRKEIESVFFTPEEYSKIEEYIRSAKEAFREFLKSSLPDIKQRAVVLEKQGQLSLRAISVKQVEQHLLRPLESLIEEEAQKKEYAAFVIFFDTYAGASHSLDIISQAEKERKGESEEAITSVLRFAGELLWDRPMTSVEGAQNYLLIKGEFRKEAQLLQDDPTGFALIDDYVGRLKNGDLEPPFGLNRTLVAMGAEWAAEAYKEIYTHLSSDSS